MRAACCFLRGAGQERTGANLGNIFAQGGVVIILGKTSRSPKIPFCSTLLRRLIRLVNAHAKSILIQGQWKKNADHSISVSLSRIKMLVGKTGATVVSTTRFISHVHEALRSINR